jgi:hypothetical protein
MPTPLEGVWEPRAVSFMSLDLPHTFECESFTIHPYAPSGGGPVTNVVTFGQTDRMEIKTITQPGKAIVIGSNVLGIARYLGHAAGRDGVL